MMTNRNRWALACFWALLTIFDIVALASDSLQPEPSPWFIGLKIFSIVCYVSALFAISARYVMAVIRSHVARRNKNDDGTYS